jgi:hypothetical protein
MMKVRLPLNSRDEGPMKQAKIALPFVSTPVLSAVVGLDCGTGFGGVAAGIRREDASGRGSENVRALRRTVSGGGRGAGKRDAELAKDKDASQECVFRDGLETLRLV